MNEIGFVLTVFFMLLGPVKLIPVFGGATRGTDLAFKRSVAVRAIVIGILLCVVVALSGEYILGKYRISIDALRLAGGLVLLVAALKSIFQKAQPPVPVAEGDANAIKLAASPIAVPGIVPPTGVAAILIFTMLAPEYQGMGMAVAISLAVVMALNYLVMHFIDQVMKPAVMLVLTVLASVFGLVQLCLGMEMIVKAFTSLGLFGV